MGRRHRAMSRPCAACWESLAMPPELLISGVGITILVPALVALANRSGLPVRYACMASVVAVGLVLGLVVLHSHAQCGGAAGWLLLSLVYGLAAAGFYSQVRRLSEGDRGPDGS